MSDRRFSISELGGEIVARVMGVRRSETEGGAAAVSVTTSEPVLAVPAFTFRADRLGHIQALIAAHAAVDQKKRELRVSDEELAAWWRAVEEFNEYEKATRAESRQ